MDCLEPLPKWSLYARISCLLKTNIMSDVNFLVGESAQIFPCHKLILGASSQVFQAMFYGDMPEKDEVIVPDITPEAFSIMLEYFYTDKITIQTETEAFDVAYAARKYILAHLYQKCEEFLTYRLKLNTQTISMIHDRADFLDMEKLKAKCLAYICRHFTDIFSSHQFPVVSKRTMKEIVKMDTINVKHEREILHILCRWAVEQCRNDGPAGDSCNLRHVIIELLKHVRFLLLTMSDVEAFLKTYNILETSEEVSIVLNIGLPKNDYVKMPFGFSSSTVKRSFSKCDRIELPVTYRYNDSNSEFTLAKRQTESAVQVVHGCVTIVGVVVALKPLPEYSRQHRTLDIELHFDYPSQHIGSSIRKRLACCSDSDEEIWELYIDDFLVISKGEKVVLTTTIAGEGVMLPEYHEEQTQKCMKNSTVCVTLPKNCLTKKTFPVKEILCIAS